MNGDMMYGRCNCCGKKAPLQRTTFRYPIECECHSPEHCILIDHCENCIPIEPQYTKVEFKTSDLKIPVSIAMKILQTALREDNSPGSYYHGWQSNIACAIMDNSGLEHDKANEIAMKFLNLLIS